ncbi:hypothetical protein_gp139 [Bacillus phage vB_BceM_WH1]|nr:hypothetical protein_gp139 [Bacillus phage vB_BceM_WH1]
MLTKFVQTNETGVSILQVINKGLVTVTEKSAYQDDVAGGYDHIGSESSNDVFVTITAEEANQLDDADIVTAAFEINGPIGVVNGRQHAARLQHLFEEEMEWVIAHFEVILEKEGTRVYQSKLEDQGYAEDVEAWLQVNVSKEPGLSVKEETTKITYKETDTLNKIGLPVGTMIKAGEESLRIIGEDTENKELDTYVVLQKPDGELVSIPAPIILDLQQPKKEEVKKALSLEEEMEMMREQNAKKSMGELHKAAPQQEPVKEEKKETALEAFTKKANQTKTNNSKEETKMTAATVRFGGQATQGATEGKATVRLGGAKTNNTNNMETKGEKTMTTTTNTTKGNQPTVRFGKGTATQTTAPAMEGFGVEGVQLPVSTPAVAPKGKFDDSQSYRGGNVPNATRKAWYLEKLAEDNRIVTNILELKRNMNLGIESIKIYDPVAMFQSGELKFAKNEKCVAIVEVVLAGGEMVMPFDIFVSDDGESLFSPNIKRMKTFKGWVSKYQMSVSNLTESTVTCCGKRIEVKDGKEFACPVCKKEMVMAVNRVVFNRTTGEEEKVQVQTYNNRKQLLPFNFQIGESLLAQVMVFAHDFFGYEM